MHRFLLSACLLILLVCPCATAAQEPADGKAARKEILDTAETLCRSKPEVRQRAEGLLTVGLEYAKAGYADKARKCLLEALQLMANEPWADPFIARVIQSAAQVGMPDVAQDAAPLLESPWAKVKALAGAASGRAAAGDTESATAIIKNAIAHLRDIPNHYQRGVAIRTIAEACAALEDKEVALSLLGDLLAVARVIDEQYRGAALEGVADTARRCGQDELALEACAAITKPADRASALVSLAFPDKKTPAPERVRSFLQPAHKAAAQATGAERAYYLARVGFVYAKAGLAEEALPILKEAQGAIARAPQVIRTEQARLAVVDAYLKLDKAADAAEMVDGMASEATQVRARMSVARHLVKRGKYKEAVAIARALPGSFAPSALLVTLAEEAARNGKYELVREIMGQMQGEQYRFNAAHQAAKQAAGNADWAIAVGFAKSIKEGKQKDAALRDAATTYLKLTTGDAAERGKRALVAEAIAAQIRTPADRATLYGKLGRTYLALDRTEDAQRMAKAMRDTGVLEVQGNKLEIAQLLAELGDMESARKVFLDALAQAKHIGCAGCRIKTMESIRRKMEECGMLEMALDGIRQLGRPLDVARGLTSIAEKYAAAGRTDEARALLAEAMKHTASIPYFKDRISALVELGAAYERLSFALGGVEEKLLADIVADAKVVEIKPGDTAGKMQLVYFYQPGCTTCHEAEALLDRVTDRYPLAHIRHLNILTAEGAEVNKSLCLKQSRPEYEHHVAPAVFSYDEALVGNDIDLDNLLALAARAKGRPAPWKVDMTLRIQATQAVADEAAGLTLLVVLGGGLADGINPCAFAVIIFFITYMAYAGKSKGEIALAGSLYTAAVFLTYLTIGVILSLVAKQEFLNAGPARVVIYIVMAALLLAAAVLSFKDGIHCLRGRTDKVALKLPDGVKRKIHHMMTRQTRKGLTVAGALSLGVLVALLEFPCTGQVYAPIIWHLSHQPASGFGWLVLYNVCFTLPLLVIFLCILFGMTSEQLTTGFKKHIATTKFVLAAVFLLLAGMLVVTIL